jgi:phenylacetate-CoA ligase
MLPPDAHHRFPLLDAAGYARLRWLEEHPSAPRFTHRGVDRLSADGLQRVRAFEAALQTEPRGWPPGQTPGWLMDFAADCFRDVPAYRAFGPLPTRFEDIPTTRRADLSRAPWDFVPDSLPLDGLTVFQTSGATGHPLDILTHPESLAHYLPLLRAALALHGLTLDPSPVETPRRDVSALGVSPPEAAGAPYVAVAVICFQATTFTYAAVSPYLEHAGLVKLNLHPGNWRDPADRAAFLNACQPLIYSGDPMALAELARLPLATRPRAILSTSMTLLPGLRQHLRERFGCPVIDIYSLNESGPVAALEPDGEAFAVLSHRLYVEVLDSEGAPCPPGVRGEITLTGGFNPFLPLLRYRTGDWAALDLSNPRQARLRGLVGRPPVIFSGVDGRPINNIDVTAALKPFALSQYALHQAADGALTLRLPAPLADPTPLRAALLALFGAQQSLSIEPFDPALEGKLIQYSRAPDA